MKRKAFPLFEKNSETIFQDIQRWENLVEGLKSIRLGKNELIQLAAVGCRENLPKLLDSGFAPINLRLLDSNKTLSLFQYKRRFGRQDQHEVTGQFLIARPTQEYIYLLVFVAEPLFWREGLRPLIESMHRKVVRPFLTQAELHRLLKDTHRTAQPHNQGIRIREVSEKKRLGGKARKPFQSDRKWTDSDFDSVFNEAKGQNVWFHTVLFDLVTERDGHMFSTGIRGKLSKYGYFSCNGRFDLFEPTIVRNLIHFSTERLKFFSNRDRLSTPDHAPRPLQISYETDIFKTTEQTKKLVGALRKFKNGTCTVLHANPYVHLSIVDNKDYSSADVWVLSQNQILVVPQLRASEAALKRIVNHIFENFREGEISEFQG